MMYTALLSFTVVQSFVDVPPPSLRKYAQFLAEVGFDLVLCQHTHAIGCLEKYKQSNIVYTRVTLSFHALMRPTITLRIINNGVKG